MASIRKIALITTLVAGLGAGAAAIAHGPGTGAGFGPGGCGGPGMMGAGMGPGMMHGPGWAGASAEDHAQFQAERLAALKQRLNITPEQEAAWNAFAEQARAHKPMHSANRGMPSPEQFAERTQVMKERLAEMEKMQGAYRQLYEALTPAQREAFGAGMRPWRRG